MSQSEGSVVWFVSAIAGALLASSAIAENAPQTRPEVLSHWTRSTISLGRLDDHQRYTTLGSGVLAAVDEHHACILTAKHMVDDPTNNWKPTEIQMRLPRNTASDTSNDQGVKISLVVNNAPLWKAIDDSDLAIIPLPDLSQVPDVHAVSVNDFGSSEDDLFQGASVLVLGYPGVIGEDPLSFPILRNGIVAWTDPADRLGHPFLVDANLMPGNSGGPVFHIPVGFNRFGELLFAGGKLSLIGIVSKVPQQNVDIHIETGAGTAQNLQWKVKGIGGIGVIEPASKAKKLVEQNCGP